MRARLTSHEKQVFIKKFLKEVLLGTFGLKKLELRYCRRSKVLNIYKINDTAVFSFGSRLGAIEATLFTYLGQDEFKSLLIELDTTPEKLARWIYSFQSYYARNVSFQDQDFFLACVAEILPGSVYW